MKLRNKKTGKIIEYSISLNQWSEDDQEWYLFGNYDSVGELKEDWEECKLTEPYIKDDKILKLVREWAKAFGVTKVYVCGIGDGKEYIERGKYKMERSGWVMLCPSCHRKIDMGKEKLCVV